MPMIDLSFPLLGPALPVDHGYELYAALSRILPALHDGLACRVAPVRGAFVGEVLQLDGRSRLRLRLAPEAIAYVMPLAGKSLEVGSHRLRIGVPQVWALVPAPALAARLVTIKGFQEPAEFLAAVRRKLDAAGIAGAAGIPLAHAGKHEGRPRRRVLRVSGKRVVGFALQVTQLTAEESILLQEQGLGGRGKMGCGFFLPARGRVP